MRITLSAVALALLVAGFGPAHETRERQEVGTKIVGGTPEQRSVLAEILAGIGSTRLRAVEITTDVDREWGASPGAVGFEAKFPRNDGYSAWQAEVVGKVFARRSFELDLPQVAYMADHVSASTLLYDWFPLVLSKPPLTRAEAEKALQRVARIAKEHGVTARLQILEPDRLAFDIELRTETPAEFLRRGLIPTLAPIEELDWGSHDGRHVKVLDGNEEWVLELGAGYGVRPDLEGCSSVVTLGRPLLAAEPPPCPAE